jgi:succinyl-CoA synthetase beta subunit
MQDPGDSAATANVKTALVRLLGARPRKADFVSRLAGTLRRQAATPEGIERALADLEAERAVLVREGSCADPHLARADLRIAALLEADAPGRDAVAQAVTRINAIWNQWLGEYMATHSCT